MRSIVRRLTAEGDRVKHWTDGSKMHELSCCLHVATRFRPRGRARRSFGVEQKQHRYQMSGSNIVIFSRLSSIISNISLVGTRSTPTSDYIVNSGRQTLGVILGMINLRYEVQNEIVSFSQISRLSRNRDLVGIGPTPKCDRIGLAQVFWDAPWAC